MAPSAESVAAGALVSLTIVMTGCVSTQQKNERAKLNAGRELAARETLRVTRINPDVSVRALTVLRSGRRTAIVAELRSSAARPLTDLPILLGVRTKGGRTVTLNASPQRSWFQRHIASLAPGRRISWVFTTNAVVPRSGRPFARVGLTPKALATDVAALPKLDAVAVGHSAVRVRNRSDVPQTDLPVYAVIRSGNRVVAAGRGELPRVGGAENGTAPIRLIGRTTSTAPDVVALPTIFE